MKSNYDGAQNEYRIKETREGYFLIEKKKVLVERGLFRNKITEKWIMVDTIGTELFSVDCWVIFGSNPYKRTHQYLFESIEEARDAARQIIIDDRLFKDGFIIHPVEVSYQQF